MDGSSIRPQFGNRLLQDEKEIFQHNAWDNVQWNEEQEQQAKRAVSDNSEITLPESKIVQLKNNAFEQWNAFYSIHQNRFFKDRHWLFTEFPELSLKCSNGIKGTLLETDKEVVNIAQPCSMPENSTCLNCENYVGDKATIRMLEVGCGVGNTVFPILENNNDPNMFIYCCDFSETAINILKSSEGYDAKRCLAFVHDLTSDNEITPFPEESLDVIICIFVLSALQPTKMEIAVKKLSSFLKPGGVLLLRDYGRYDLAQLRFKKGRCIGENFYARGDGTFCYFFTQEEIKKLMESAGLKEIQNLVDRRLQVNRGKQLTMYRVWIQAKYQKPLPT